MRRALIKLSVSMLAPLIAALAIIGLAIWLANRLGGGRLAARGDAAPVGM